jgi:hypothetical protein
MDNQDIGFAKLAIVIVIIAALLFLVAPKLCWANCSPTSVGSGKSLDGRLAGIRPTASYGTPRAPKLRWLS